ncbi:MAG: VWA domain-containing protein [Polyangiaceae bacterium]
MKLRAAPRASMGATPGGAQDIDYARDRIRAGEVPHEKTFTAEGLLSQHDLPLPSNRPCMQILCLSGAAANAELVAQPEVRYLAQLGFASNLDPKTWRRKPLNLVAVVDKSGSMSGDPLDTVKASLRQVATQMTSRDRLAIVLYGDRSHVHLAPTSLSRRNEVLTAIDQIQSAGSTAMEEGLRVGFDLAARSRSGFAGQTRVMLFTDERPNVGATDKDSFMGMARAASRQGIGLTTVGVSTHFGAELATAISSVRGGNLVFFPQPGDMRARFTRDFDTLVTELAHDMRLEVTPRKGFELVGLYGVPGEMVKRTKSGGLSMEIETIFLSKDKGGIYFGFAPKVGALPAPAGAIADVQLTYVDTQKRRNSDQLSFPLLAKAKMPLGLARGMLLVDEVTTLKKASILHGQQNKTEEAYQLVRALHKRMNDAHDGSLAKELELVATLNKTLTRLSGHKGEDASAGQLIARDAVSGIPH